MLEFLPKKRSKTIQTTTPVQEQKHEDGTVADMPTQKPAKKKGWSSTDMVMVGGVVAIMAGMFWVMSRPSEVEKPVANPAKEKVKKEQAKQSSVVETKKEIPATEKKQQKPTESLPFVYGNKADFADENLMPPPEDYERNNTALAQKNVTAEKTKVVTAPTQKPIVPKTQERVAVKKPLTAVPAPQTQKPAPEVEHTSYVCHVMPRHTEMIGKEIMYYTKDAVTHKYLPAHRQKNWDESGVWIKEKLIASQVDIDESMAEISTGKWIPALEFMNCTLVEEERR